MSNLIKTYISITEHINLVKRKVQLMKLLTDIPKNNIVNVAQNKVFVKDVTLKEACNLEGRSLRPNEAQNLFLKNFRKIAPDCIVVKDSVIDLLSTYGAYVGMAFASEKPFAEYIKDGNLYVRTKRGGETIECTSPVDNLVKAGIGLKKLEKNNQILCVFDFYNVEQTHEYAAFSFFDSSHGSMQMLNWCKDVYGWSKSKNGLVSAKKTDGSNASDLYNFNRGADSGILIGAILRGYYVVNYKEPLNTSRVISIGGSSDHKHGVFKDTTGTSLEHRK